jgi:hypothetical protein
MTEDQQRAVIGEFIATRLSLQELKSTVDFVREEMAGLMVAFAESVPSRTPEPRNANSSLTNLETRLEKLELNAADMLFKLKQQREDIRNLSKVLDHRTERSATQTDSPRTVDEAVTIRTPTAVLDWVPTQPPAPAEQDSTKTDPNKERSANQMYQAALENRCGICGLDRSVHLGGSGHDWVPTPATEPPVQDSSKTDLEESK